MGSDATFLAYIDESGDEGFRFGAGSSAWFVLAAVILRRAMDGDVLALVDEVRDRINQGRKPEQRIPPKKPLHFRDLKHEQRKFFAAKLGQADLRTACVMVHKPDLTSPEKFTREKRRKNGATAWCSTTWNGEKQKRQTPSRRIPPTSGCRP